MTGDGGLVDQPPARTILPEPRSESGAGEGQGDARRGKSRRRVLAQAGTLTAGAIVASTVVDPFALASGRIRKWGTGATGQAPPGSTWSSPSLPTTSPSSPPTITASGLPTYPLPTGAAVTGNLLGRDPVWHLLRRATYGPTPQLIADLRARGANAWLEEQLKPSSIDDSACTAYVAAAYPSLAKSVTQIRSSYSNGSWTAMTELGMAKIARSVLSKRQLFEMMVEFWHDHLHVASPSSEVWDVMTSYDRDVIRPFAFGRFSDLLLASAKHPAMLRILNNYQSSVDTLNENYGRELLELHTVGVQSGYTQAEVVDSARILTGWTVGRHGEFAYYNDWHYTGPVKVLGFSAANSDQFGGLTLGAQYLDYLAHHPATARHLAYKLAVRFVSDYPSAALVDKLATVYLNNDTAIPPVLGALFTDNEFLNSYGAKLRRPFEDVTASFRAVGVTPSSGVANSFGSMYWSLSALGHQPMAWHAPDGYPDTADAWLSTGGTLGRWNLHMGVLGRWWSDGFTLGTPAALLGGSTPATLGALVDAMTNRLLGVTFASGHRQALLDFLTSSDAGAVSSAMQWRLDVLGALILDSPYGLQR
jgi:uncharacterized protein (DUF1800 family)